MINDYSILQCSSHYSRIVSYRFLTFKPIKFNLSNMLTVHKILIYKKLSKESVILPGGFLVAIRKKSLRIFHYFANKNS